MGLLEWLDSLPGNLLALLALAFALWRYLDRKFERIDTQFVSLNRDIGEVKGELKAVQGLGAHIWPRLNDLRPMRP